MAKAVLENHTSYVAIHPYFGYVCRPNVRVDFGLKVPAVFGHGVDIEIDRDGFRNTDMPAVKPDNEYWIAIVGGSAAFSILSSNHRTTIAGYLETTLAPAIPGRRVRVLNLALPGGKQPQQFHILSHYADVLDGVVAFDGHNEAMVPAGFAGKVPAHFPFFHYYAVLFNRPVDEEHIALSWLLEYLQARRTLRAILGPLIRNIRRRLTELSLRKSEELSSIYPCEDANDLEAIMEAGASRWSDYSRMLAVVARAKSVETLFVLQPVPELGKPLTPREQADLDAQAGISARRLIGRRYLQAGLQRMRDDGLLCSDFTDVFTDRSDDIYGDNIHFEDKGCQIVASRIAQLITDNWTLPT